jgi:hypothetical protein
MLECKEDEEKEGCGNMVMGEDYMPEAERWRASTTPGSKWIKRRRRNPFMSIC